LAAREQGIAAFVRVSAGMRGAAAKRDVELGAGQMATHRRAERPARHAGAEMDGDEVIHVVDHAGIDHRQARRGRLPRRAGR